MIKLSPEKAAIKVVNNYIKGLNARDQEIINDNLHFPHIRIMKDGTFCEWKTAKEYLCKFENRLKNDGWDHTVLTKINTEIISITKVHATISFDRYKANKQLIDNYRSFYIVIKTDGYWGIKIGSGTG
jgi:hypothetical protein